MKTNKTHILLIILIVVLAIFCIGTAKGDERYFNLGNIEVTQTPFTVSNESWGEFAQFLDTETIIKTKYTHFQTIDVRADKKDLSVAAFKTNYGIDCSKRLLRLEGVIYYDKTTNIIGKIEGNSPWMEIPPNSITWLEYEMVCL